MTIKKKPKIYKIFLAGCGNIGFRYYEALIKSDMNIELYIFDKYKKNYINFLNSRNNKLKILKIKSIKNLKKKN